MKTVLRTRVVKIGNSQGIRIPKLLLEQFNLKDEVELLLKDDMLVMRGQSSPRRMGRAMPAHGGAGR